MARQRLRRLVLMKSRKGGCCEQCCRWKWREIPSRNPIGSGSAPIVARELVGSVEGAISWENRWANPNGELGNGIDIWRDYRGEKNNL